MPAKNSNAMDALQMILAKANEVNSIELNIYGEKITLNYKPLGWRSINRSLSAAMEYGQTVEDQGSVSSRFRIDKYYIAALNEMIVNPPFPLTETFWNALPREVGIQLEAIIPNPFSVNQEMNEDIEETGKE